MRTPDRGADDCTTTGRPSEWFGSRPTRGSVHDRHESCALSGVDGTEFGFWNLTHAAKKLARCPIVFLGRSDELIPADCGAQLAKCFGTSGPIDLDALVAVGVLKAIEA